MSLSSLSISTLSLSASSISASSLTSNGVIVGSAANRISGLATIVNGSGTITLNTTGTITIPSATDTLVGLATSDVLTNKAISLVNNSLSGFTTGSIVFMGSTVLTQNNSKIFWNNTTFRLGLGTASPGYTLDASTGSVHANSVIVGSAVNTISGLATIINGTGTINTNTTGTITVPSATDTLVGKATNDTLTNKTISGSVNTLSNIGDGSLSISYLKSDGTRALTANWAAGAFSATHNSVAVGSAVNTISGLASIINGSGTVTLNTTGTITIPSVTDTLVGKATSDILTNKTLSLASNTFGGFTAGSILFHNGTTIAQKNGNLFWDNVNNRLGIGTIGPGYSIDVQGGSINASAGIYDNGVRLFGRPSLGQQVSLPNTGQAATGSYADITNLSVTLTTSGRPVMIVLQPNAGYAVGSSVEVGASGGQGIVQLLRDVTALYIQQYYNSASGNVGFPGGITYVDVVGAGTYTYKMQLKKGSAPGVTHSNYTLVAFEL